MTASRLDVDEDLRDDGLDIGIPTVAIGHNFRLVVFPGRSTSTESMRRLRHWRIMALSSHSATFNQTAALRVQTNSEWLISADEEPHGLPCRLNSSTGSGY